MNRTEGIAELSAVVLIVRVTKTFVTNDVNVTLAGLKLQVLCGGRFEHADGDNVVDPVNPACAVNVKVVDPDCPGLGTVIARGFAVIPKVGVGPIPGSTTIS